MDESKTVEDDQHIASPDTEKPALSGPGAQQACMSLSAKALLESLLFVADEPIQIQQLATAIELSTDAVQTILHELSEEYSEQRGLRLQFKGQQVQMVTAPEATEVIQRFLGLEHTSRLSPAALESLAIVAYQQPVTRAQVEAIRGVNSDSVLRTLVNRGLVEELGRLEQAGRPIIYGTTFEFLQQFGLSNLEQLPPLEPADSPPENSALPLESQ